VKKSSNVQGVVRVSRKVKGSNNRDKARRILGKRHLKISRQRKDHAIKLARGVISSNDVVVVR
jgi:putative transposase